MNSNCGTNVFFGTFVTFGRHSAGNTVDTEYWKKIVKNDKKKKTKFKDFCKTVGLAIEEVVLCKFSKLIV